MIAVGGVLLTEIATGALVVDRFCASVTRSLALKVPAWVYVCVGATAVESPNVPSPLRSHE